MVPENHKNKRRPKQEQLLTSSARQSRLTMLKAFPL